MVMVFRTKRNFKNTRYSLFENLTPRRAMIMKEAKKIAGFNKVWSKDGNILIYCLTKISMRAKRSISRVFSLFIVPSLFSCTLPLQRPY